MLTNNSHYLDGITTHSSKIYVDESAFRVRLHESCLRLAWDSDQAYHASIRQQPFLRTLFRKVLNGSQQLLFT